MAAYSYHQFESSKEQFYRRLIELRGTEDPRHILALFNGLLTRSEAGDVHLAQLLDQIVGATWATEEFALFLNRCCYILINHWSVDTETKRFIYELVKLLKLAPQEPRDDGQGDRLLQLLTQFHQTQHYKTLVERAKAETQGFRVNPKGRRLGELIHRYPALYPSYFLRWDDSEAGRRAVQDLQRRRETEFETELRRYARQVGRHSASGPSFGQGAGGPIANPTLLTDPQLSTALHEFAGTPQKSSHRYRQSAHAALDHLYGARSHHSLKQQLGEYLVSGLEQYQTHYQLRDYGRHRFNRWLEEKLMGILPEQDSQRPTEKLLVLTCTGLIDTFLAHPRSPGRNSDHLMFVDLITNIGATLTIGLLLKIMLLCERFQANLDGLRDRVSQRFASLFQHYEHTESKEVNWLLPCMDNLMVASAIHFGPDDRSMWRAVLQTIR